VRHRGEHRNQPRGVRLFHLSKIFFGVAFPSLVGPLVCERPGYELRTGREIRHPDVIPVFLCEVRFLYSSGWSADRAESRAFIAKSWLPEPDNSYRHSFNKCCCDGRAQGEMNGPRASADSSGPTTQQHQRLMFWYVSTVVAPFQLRSCRCEVVFLVR
jgi:hypothetical protein